MAATVVVTGDVTIDWNVAYHPPAGVGLTAPWLAKDTGALNWQRGGAALLADVIHEIAKYPDPLLNTGTEPQYTVIGVKAPKEGTNSPQVDPRGREYHHSFALWDRNEPSEKPVAPVHPWGRKDLKPAGQESDKRWVWRVSQYLGFEHNPEAIHPLADGAESRDVKLIVLDDAGHGFRDHNFCDLGPRNNFWPKVLCEERFPPERPWIVLKMSGKIGESNNLLNHLLTKCFSKRIIVVLSSNDLRATRAVQISRSLSWERTAEDVARELRYNPRLYLLQKCRHVVVSFGTAGAVLMSSNDGKGTPTLQLFYDPRVLEDDWEIPQWGRMLGYTTTLTATLVRQLMLDLEKDEPDLGKAIRLGINAMRELYRSGYRCCGSKCATLGYDYQYEDPDKAHSPALVFPKKELARYLAEASKKLNAAIADGFDLQLTPSANEVSDLSTQGRNLIILARVRDELHFRIFDADGQSVADTREGQLPDKLPQITELKSLLSGLWDVPKITQADRERIIISVRHIINEIKERPIKAIEDSGMTLLASMPIPPPDHPKAIPLLGGGNHWSILKDLISTNDPIEMAIRVASRGLSNETNFIPSWEVGKLYTVDRREIEALRSIRRLIRDYALHRTMAQPLNLAVFGPPGAGKSFAVEQVAESILQPGGMGPSVECACRDIKIEMKTFNISQFYNPDALYGAFHQVRDIGLSGKLPMVFWDEFDAKLGDQPLGWLRYFLAPMQNGNFVEGAVTHSIGRCIFVFAGGVYSRIGTFNKVLTGEEIQAGRPRSPTSSVACMAILTSSVLTKRTTSRETLRSISFAVPTCSDRCCMSTRPSSFRTPNPGPVTRPGGTAKGN